MTGSQPQRTTAWSSPNSPLSALLTRTLSRSSISVIATRRAGKEAAVRRGRRAVRPSQPRSKGHERHVPEHPSIGGAIHRVRSRWHRRPRPDALPQRLRPAGVRQPAERLHRPGAVRGLLGPDLRPADHAPVPGAGEHPRLRPAGQPAHHGHRGHPDDAAAHRPGSERHPGRDPERPARHRTGGRRDDRRRRPFPRPRVLRGSIAPGNSLAPIPVP